MRIPDLSDTDRVVLRAIHAEGTVDLYALAQMVGTAPRTVQEAVVRLRERELVTVFDRGVRVRCTPDGDEVARSLDGQHVSRDDE